jgi:hypothetical protein
MDFLQAAPHFEVQKFLVKNSEAFADDNTQRPRRHGDLAQSTATMSFRGGRGGGGSRGGRGGGGGTFNSIYNSSACDLVHGNADNNAGRGGYPARDFGPPDTVLEMGTFMHACEGEIVCESTNTKVPYFNAPIYLENKVRSFITPSSAISSLSVRVADT